MSIDDRGSIQALRSFNRTVTERVGALEDHYLSRSRPLGASRVLWEIGHGGADVRSIRARLGLDSGYLSRLLRALEHDGLIEVAQHVADTRVRSVQLTAAGRSEWQLLDANSDALAESLLEPLTASQRDRLIEAVSTVEQLFTAGMVTLDVEDASSADAQWCIESYFAEIDARFEHGFDRTIARTANVDELTEPAGLLILARLRGEPVGCGGLMFHGTEPAEIKRVWVAAAARGLGLGRRLLVDLERRTANRGVSVVRLDTNRSLTEAIAMYRSSGYAEVPAFNDEPFAHHWFEKHLG